MADMLIPNQGKQLIATMGIGNTSTAQEDYWVELFSNNYTPVDASVKANFTPPTTAGYARVAVTRASFGAPFIVANVGFVTSSVSPTFNFTASSGESAYGWFMYGQTSNWVYAAALFDAPLALVNGAQIELTPFQFGCKTFV